MRKIIQSGRFKRDFKRVLKRGCSPEKLAEVIELLMSDTPLPARCRPHRLVGDYSGYWECHIAPDWLLVYDLSEDELILAATGSHADLFR